MTDIQRYMAGHTVTPRASRRLDRTLVGLQVGREVRQVQTDVEAGVVISKIENLTLATRAGSRERRHRLGATRTALFVGLGTDDSHCPQSRGGRGDHNII